jgi:N-acetyl-anhydromuramyl-L-alanine amidase AmpD
MISRLDNGNELESDKLDADNKFRWRKNLDDTKLEQWQQTETMKKYLDSNKKNWPMKTNLVNDNKYGRSNKEHDKKKKT